MWVTNKIISPALLLGLAVGCVGCAGRLNPNVLSSAASGNFESTSRVTILAATTRRKSNVPGKMFNSQRAQKVSYASITVSIPPDSARKIGEIQWPAVPPGDPQRDFVTTSADVISKQRFADELSAATRQPNRSKVLIFVHGFNTRFDEAVYRFAQIVHDSNAPGIPVLFAWPSRGQIKLRAYTYDRESANYSRDALDRLIEQIASNPRVKEINIVAHSMGNWLTLEALRTMSIRNKHYPGKIKNVLLVAPDVDVDVFRTELHRIAAPKLRIAVFMSRDDKALALSRTIWGGVPRVGDIDPNSEPYRSEFERDHIEAFDLTKLKSVGDNAHDRAFQDVTTVMIMMKKRFGENQQIALH
jgi:esterase/lipase superfamily enzyme